MFSKTPEILQCLTSPRATKHWLAYMARGSSCKVKLRFHYKLFLTSGLECLLTEHSQRYLKDGSVEYKYFHPMLPNVVWLMVKEDEYTSTLHVPSRLGEDVLYFDGKSITLSKIGDVFFDCWDEYCSGNHPNVEEAIDCPVCYA